MNDKNSILLNYITFLYGNQVNSNKAKWKLSETRQNLDAFDFTTLFFGMKNSRSQINCFCHAWGETCLGHAETNKLSSSKILIAERDESLMHLMKESFEWILLFRQIIYNFFLHFFAVLHARLRTQRVPQYSYFLIIHKHRNIVIIIAIYGCCKCWWSLNL